MASTTALKEDKYAKVRFLCELAAEGSIKELRSTFESSARIKSIVNQRVDGRTALHFCAAASETEVLVGTQLHTACAEFLLQNGANAFIKDRDGRLALHLAVMASNPSLVELLLTARPGQPNAVDNKKWTPLMYAATGRCKTTAKLLLKNYANPYMVDKDGNTALIIAARYRNAEVFKLLVKFGADLYHENTLGESAKTIVLNQRWTSMDDWIKKYLSILEKDQEERNALEDTKRLCKLASRGELKSMEELVRKNPSVVSKKYPLYLNRSPLLCTAAASKHYYSEGTVDHTECAKILVRYGADANCQDSELSAPLHLSVKANNISLTKFLVEETARVKFLIDKQNNELRTPLMLAAEFDYAEQVEILLKSGANLVLTDKFNRTAKEIAVAEESYGALGVIQQHFLFTFSKTCDDAGRYISQISSAAGRVRSTVDRAVGEAQQVWQQLPSYFDHHARPLQSELDQAKDLGDKCYEQCQSLVSKWKPVQRNILQLLGSPGSKNKAEVSRCIEQLKECIDSANECKTSLLNLKMMLAQAVFLSRELAESCRREIDSLKSQKLKEGTLIGTIGGAVGGAIGFVAGLWSGPGAFSSAAAGAALNAGVAASTEVQDLTNKIEKIESCMRRAQSIREELENAQSNLGETASQEIAEKFSSSLKELETLAAQV